MIHHLIIGNAAELGGAIVGGIEEAVIEPFYVVHIKTTKNITFGSLLIDNEPLWWSSIGIHELECKHLHKTGWRGGTAFRATHFPFWLRGST
jgi:hypothetical protein